MVFLPNKFFSSLNAQVQFFHIIGNQWLCLNNVGKGYNKFKILTLIAIIHDLEFKKNTQKSWCGNIVFYAPHSVNN